MHDSPTTHFSSPRGWLLTAAVAGFAFLAATLVPVQPTVAQGQPAVDIQAATDGISVEFFATTPRNVLTFSVRVVGPDRFVFEQRIEGASLQWIPPDNLADGLYGWEAWVVTADVGAQMRTLTPALEARSVDHWYTNEVKQTHIASGHFKAGNGLLEEIGPMKIGESEEIPRIRRVAGAILDFLVPSVHAQLASFANDDFVIFNPNNDECTTLRLHNDTSELDMKMQNHGGDIQFRTGDDTDCTVGTNIMAITRDGNVGIGTTTPSAALEIAGSFPQIQMNLAGGQWLFGAFDDGSGANPSFGVVELATFTLPFSILGDAPSSSLIIRGDSTGFGTITPAAPIHVQRANNTAEVRVEDTGASDPGPGQTMFNLINNGPTKFRMEDTSQADVRWEFRTSGIQDDNERFQMNKLGSGVVEMQVFAGGDVTIAGSLFQASSRTVKEGIVDLNPEEVLTRLDALPVHEWSYKRSPQERHLGPMAEDFHAAFGLGRDSKHISPGDLAGVALAAAKAVNAKLVAETTVLKAESMDKDRRIAELDSTTRVMHAENAELRSRLERLEAMIFDVD